jgi:hypothetical protein
MNIRVLIAGREGQVARAMLARCRALGWQALAMGRLRAFQIGG